MKKLFFILTLLILATMSSCNNKQQVIKGNFIHSVYFWLKNPDSETDRIAFETSLKKFINSSEFIIQKHIGSPATTNRQVIDNSYTYSLILTFENKEMQDKYQEENVHKIFIKESEHLWEKVLVYDSENSL
ncbi:Dabb family protein [Abyssalbus ytuae]|uniref:Dabb family protein n=1 Tax=Abyssalbus ytuae TaxID=2926907 RepID=A0A9E7A3N0_9FLAO|nr:Dabb family protein [Abyssalbus ytuae]UOB19281.1 Dabb family protein [Abyssalbus ytuae]